MKDKTEEINVRKISDGKSEGTTPVMKPMCRQDDNIKMDLKRTGCENVDWLTPKDAIG
jgi:hypothetical protein